MITVNNCKGTYPLSKEQFEIAASKVRSNIMSYLPEMISFKKCIQVEVLDIATHKELENVRDSIYTQSMVDKLVNLAAKKWEDKANYTSLYCAAMAVGTIIKEYEWGSKWISPDGLYELANQIINE